MKKKTIVVICVMLLVSLLLCGCGKPRIFTVDSTEDNTITVTAERAPKGSGGIGYLEVGESGQILIQTNLEKKGEIRIRVLKGTLGSDNFGDEAVVDINLSGEGGSVCEVESGTYTVSIQTVNTVTGSALIREAPVETAG